MSPGTKHVVSSMKLEQIGQRPCRGHFVIVNGVSEQSQNNMVIGLLWSRDSVLLKKNQFGD